MTYGQETAVSNLQAGAANLTSDIMRSVVDRVARAKALGLLAQALDAAVAGTVMPDSRPAAKRFNA